MVPSLAHPREQRSQASRDLRYFFIFETEFGQNFPTVLADARWRRFNGRFATAISDRVLEQLHATRLRVVDFPERIQISHPRIFHHLVIVEYRRTPDTLRTQLRNQCVSVVTQK